MRRVSAAMSCQESCQDEAACARNHICPSYDQTCGPSWTETNKMAAEGGNRKAENAAVPCLPASTGELVHGLGELDVELGEAAGVMGRQRHFDIFVDVEPLGVMVELFRHQRGAGHEAEGLIEIGKDEFLGDGVATADLDPAFEPGECTLARFA